MKVLNAVAILCSLSAVIVIGDIFRSLDVAPNNVRLFDPSRPTVAVFLLLFAFAALSLAATSAATIRTASRPLSIGLGVTAIIVAVAAWALHQALWHLVHGLSHAGPYWFGKS